MMKRLYSSIYCYLKGKEVGADRVVAAGASSWKGSTSWCSSPRTLVLCEADGCASCP